MKDYKNILVIKMSSLGDIIHALPSLYALRELFQMRALPGRYMKVLRRYFRENRGSTMYMLLIENE